MSIFSAALGRNLSVLKAHQLIKATIIKANRQIAISAQIIFLISPHYLTSSTNSFSLIILTPSSFALSYFSPGSEPAATKLVFLETNSETSSPRVWIYLSCKNNSQRLILVICRLY